MTRRPLKRSTLWALGFYAVALVAALSIALALHFAKKPALNGGPARFTGPSPVMLSLTFTNSYVGDEACVACHQQKVTTYHHTAHYITSAWPTTESIKGKFTPGANVMRTADPNLHFEMQASATGQVQTAIRQVSPAVTGHRTERFDLVVGSGRKGQTYAFWKDDLLYQLPVSYWTEFDEWVNSPGYPDGVAIFERPISTRCLECHATTFKSLSPPDNRYDKTSLVPGMTCEKCHGPGATHVARYRSSSPPKSRAQSAILNPATFSRERKMDACALCHGGGGTPIAPSLSFVPGGVLKNFLEFPKRNPNEHVDVHGSQVFLLEQSRCYQSNATMTCSTCHDVHQPQRDVTAFAANCRACHKVESCGIFAKRGHEIDNQCVVCHMPLQQTDQIISSANGKRLQPMVRNHRIAIYPE